MKSRPLTKTQTRQHSRAQLFNKEKRKMKKLLARRILLFGRSISLTTILLALTVISVGAWGAFLAAQANARATIAVADAPVPISVSYPVASRYCQVNTQNGQGTLSASGSWNAGTSTYSCNVTEFDDVSEVEWGLGVQNDNGFVINISSILPADTACVDFIEVQAFAPTLAGGANGAAIYRAAGLPGAGGTLSCAGTSLPDLSVQVDITD